MMTTERTYYTSQANVEDVLENISDGVRTAHPSLDSAKQDDERIFSPDDLKDLAYYKVEIKITLMETR